jgi:hypothetical protein
LAPQELARVLALVRQGLVFGVALVLARPELERQCAGPQALVAKSLITSSKVWRIFSVYAGSFCRCHSNWLIHPVRMSRGVSFSNLF